MASTDRASATSPPSHAMPALGAYSSTSARRRSLLSQSRPLMDVSHDSVEHAAAFHEHESSGSRNWKPEADKTHYEKGGNISLSMPSKAAGKVVGTFLAKHIPDQYNPLGNREPHPSMSMDVEDKSKYCYRHRPDLKCRRQANEPSMEMLQQELSTVSKVDQQGITHVWSLFSAAPSKQRELMLQGILAQCCFPQLSMVSASIRELIKIDFLFALPPELGFKVLCYLDTTSLCKAAQVSRHWRALADDDVVWHKMCEQHIDRKCTKCGWGLPLLERKRLRAEKRSIQLRAADKGITQWTPQGTPPPDTSALDGEQDSERVPSTSSSNKRALEVDAAAPEEAAKRLCQSFRSDTPEAGRHGTRKRPWKDVYKQRFKVGTNWKYGRCRTKVFKAHDNGVMCLQFSENILATGSYDSTIKIWDLNDKSPDPQPIQVLRGHSMGIRCLQFDHDQGLLISGSIDKTIRMWDWRTGALKRVLRGHHGGVISLHWASGILASGSQDHTVRVWDGPKCEVYTLSGHSDWVNSVKVDVASRTVLSASDDGTVKLWDLDARKCIQTLEGHVGQVQQLVVMPPEFDVDEEDLQSADGHDTDTEPEDHPDQHHNHTRAANNSANGRAHTLTSSPTLDHSAPSQPVITPLYQGSSGFDEERPEPPKYILTGSLDSTIRLWHLPTAKCIRTFFGHLEGIWALAADTLRVVSGAEDRMVKVWDPRTGRNERVFTGHTGPVTCIGLSDSRLVTGSEDCDVRVMEFGCQDEEEAGEERARSKKDVDQQQQQQQQQSVSTGGAGVGVDASS